MTNFVILTLFVVSLNAAPLRVGRAAVKITPEPGTPMAGYYNIRLATGTHDDLMAKAIVFEKDGKKAALVACDLVALAPDIIEDARRITEQATGIPGASIMISATHSHTGPVITGRGTRDSAYGGDMPILKKYMAELPARIAESVKQANATLREARVSVGVGKEPALAFNRRFFMKDGTVGWNAGKLNPNIVKPAGPIDPDVNVVYLEAEDKTPLASYVNYACHLDTVGGMEWSADYPYTLSSILGKVKGADMLTVFTIGTAGNINHIDVSTKRPQKGHVEAERIGTVLAGEVLKTYTRMMPAGEGPLRTRSEIVPLTLPKVTPSDVDRARTIAAKIKAGESTKFLDSVFAFQALDVAARQGKAFHAEVQVIALGNDIAWVALPGEIFVELGMAIKKASPFPNTIVVELAHGPTTYIPNDAAFAQGNYEVVSSRVAQGSGEKLVETAVRLLKEIQGK
jgi:neutral ceramidase